MECSDWRTGNNILDTAPPSDYVTDFDHWDIGVRRIFSDSVNKLSRLEEIRYLRLGEWGVRHGVRAYRKGAVLSRIIVRQCGYEKGKVADRKAGRIRTL